MWGHGLSLTDVLDRVLSFYVFAGLGVTIGYHRYFTHQSFETNRFVRGLLAVAGSMAVQGPVITWVADHRRHHAFADKEGDPHSPHLDEGSRREGRRAGAWRTRTWGGCSRTR